MTIEVRPFTFGLGGDDGPYSADDWAATWASMMNSENSIGVVGRYLNGLKVSPTSPTSAAVDVETGGAFIAGRSLISDSVETVNIAANVSGNPRIDIIVAEYDITSVSGDITVVQGTPAVTPTPPPLTQDTASTYQIPLAYVDVSNGFVTITADDITDERQFAEFPLVSGSMHLAGSVASQVKNGWPVALGTNYRRVNQSDITASLTIGVSKHTADTGDDIQIVDLGYSEVQVAGTTSVGDYLRPDSSGILTPDNNSVEYIGITEVARTGAGFTEAFIRPWFNKGYIQLDTSTGFTTTGVHTTYQTTDLQLTGIKKHARSYLVLEGIFHVGRSGAGTFEYLDLRVYNQTDGAAIAPIVFCYAENVAHDDTMTGKWVVSGKAGGYSYDFRVQIRNRTNNLAVDLLATSIFRCTETFLI